jgi:hypothetical protein
MTKAAIVRAWGRLVRAMRWHLWQPDFMAAHDAFRRAHAARHAPLPDWVETRSSVGGNPKDGGWQLQMSVYRRHQLQPGEEWVDYRPEMTESPSLVRRDPATGEIVRVLFPEDDDEIVLARGYVDRSLAVRFDVDIDLADFDRDEMGWHPMP